MPPRLLEPWVREDFQMWIRNPAEWGATQIAATGHVMRSLGHALIHTDVDHTLAEPKVRRISYADLREVLVKGFNDFGAFRDDVLFICIIYPAAGLVLAAMTSHVGLMPLIFPLFSGFTLIGPFAALWLYEMSRRRERGEDVSWVLGFEAFASASAAAIFKLGLLLIAIFAVWLATAMGIYMKTMGPEMPASMGSFASDVFTTPSGWMLIGVGVGVGFLFALVALSISVVSFPLLLDRHVGIATAISTSVQAMRVNPGPLLAWGFIVAGSLVVGMLPVLTGLIIVLPVLGHATWHLYRKLVV
jgi:uncharacterized membrane protein